MLRAGFIGWRGMVGSVLMQRMRDENDFAGIEPVFFTTSNVGGVAPLEHPASLACRLIFRPCSNLVNRIVDGLGFILRRDWQIDTDGLQCRHNIH
jgi:hypothetical protein